MQFERISPSVPLNGMEKSMGLSRFEGIFPTDSMESHTWIDMRFRLSDASSLEAMLSRELTNTYDCLHAS